MDLKWNPDRVSHLGSSEVRVTDWNWRGNRNPNPLIKDDGELLMEEHLSPRKLKALAGVDDLQQVKALEMRVDTRETSLGNFGVHLPNLRELNLNNSLLVSVRDLGTSLSHLCVLWMACCGLSDLDGISSCSSLKELYVAYNNISELSQLTWLDHLEVLDLEGNNIEDIDQMQYLRLCCKLSHLTVEGNLICLKPNAESAEEPGYNYRAEVKKLIPHLKYLDKIPANQTVPLPSKKMYEDCLIIKESIKEGGLAGDISWLDPYLGAVARQSGCGPRPPTTSRPGNAQWSANVGRFSDAQLLYGSRLLPDPAVSDMLFSEDDSSDLTHGLSQVICGNPAKALRERRQKLGPPAASPLELSGLRTENLYGSGGGKDEHQENVSSELRVWREQQKRFVTDSGGCSVLQPKPLFNSIPSKKPFTCICNECCSKTLENKKPQGKMPKNTQPRGGQAVYTAMPVKGSSRKFSPASGRGTCFPEPAQDAVCFWISRAAPACWLHQPTKAYSRTNSCWINKDWAHHGRKPFWRDQPPASSCLLIHKSLREV
ncbi:leucine-rich repeat-containing protein 56 isoform X4 [Myiozetetes cayanensis]|uniref:leucine-rich repeat-containing protein 56 isoform X4 n=1 Tax=Myiozetetes cayanensis TaxID=478635 RepID=UPI0021610652|nr:leucine-rich repeat-containing protein 56 isoform X4 [Myiozetetes cayanensis]